VHELVEASRCPPLVPAVGHHACEHRDRYERLKPAMNTAGALSARRARPSARAARARVRASSEVAARARCGEVRERSAIEVGRAMRSLRWPRRRSTGRRAQRRRARLGVAQKCRRLLQQQTTSALALISMTPAARRRCAGWLSISSFGTSSERAEVARARSIERAEQHR